jgi:hypothetical protein
MNQYTHEVDFLRHEVEKCHASMHSQVETLKLLMEAHLELKKKVERPWVGLMDEEISNVMPAYCHNEFELNEFRKLAKAIEAKLKEKNGG